MSNMSFKECCALAEQAIQQGGTVYQKFTCVGCGERRVVIEPNTFYTEAKCEECGHITNLATTGCGFMLVIAVKPPNLH